MTFIRLKAILDVAKRIHISSISRIDFDKEDKKHAIYLLQGGVLTAVSNAFQFNLNGFYVPTTQQKRLIDEAIDLIWFFDENLKKQRQLRAWFAGRIVERVPGNEGNLTLKQRAEINLLDIDRIQKMDDLQKTINHIVSEVMHPTIKAMRANSSKRTHLFDYDNLTPKKPQYSPENFGNMFVVPSLFSLLIPIRHLQVNNAQFDILRSYVRDIENNR
ncbi:MAG: hypothetical protein Q7T54_04915 [Candidatus Levybacteria bacterium]|nr:hypothetical protein [Candidatus Levybacteria bacterium]